MNREHHHAGKGDDPRPVDGETYRNNYDRIFRTAIHEVCKLCDDCDCMQDHNFDSHDEYTYQEVS